MPQRDHKITAIAETIRARVKPSSVCLFLRIYYFPSQKSPLITHISSNLTLSWIELETPLMCLALSVDPLSTVYCYI